MLQMLEPRLSISKKKKKKMVPIIRRLIYEEPNQRPASAKIDGSHFRQRSVFSQTAIFSESTSLRLLQIE